MVLLTSFPCPEKNRLLVSSLLWMSASSLSLIFVCPDKFNSCTKMSVARFLSSICVKVCLQSQIRLDSYGFTFRIYTTAFLSDRIYIIVPFGNSLRYRLVQSSILQYTFLYKIWYGWSPGILLASKSKNPCDKSYKQVGLLK